jgi:hypothetical protein
MPAAKPTRDSGTNFKHCTLRWMWKNRVVCSSRIIEHSHVMNRSRPSSIDKCESHVKVTTCHHILCSDVLAAHVLDNFVTWHHTLHMSPIYSPYAVVEVGIKPGFLSLPWTVVNCGSTSLIMSSARSTKQSSTLWKKLETVPQWPLKSVLSLPNRLWWPNLPKEYP